MMQAIEVLKADSERGFSMTKLYRFLGISKQSQDRRRKSEQSHEELKRKVRDLVIEHRGVHAVDGSRQTYYGANAKKMLGIGVTKFEQIVSELGMTVKCKRQRVNLSERCSRSKKYPNLTNGKVLTGINQLIVGDLTELNTGKQKWYVFVLIDLYSGRIVGMSGGSRMTAKVASEALTQFLGLRGKGKYPNLIHHTDGGSQYFSDLYLSILKSAEIQISVATNCLENGHAEQKNGTVKNRYLRFMDLSSEEMFQKSLAETKRLINNERIMQSRLNQTPLAFETQMMALPEDKRRHVVLHDFKINQVTDTESGSSEAIGFANRRWVFLRHAAF